MEKPSISIIVPVYNMEKYLRECLNSIKNQTFTDWECIIIDDGSTDNSPGICDEFVSTDSRFKVLFHKNNEGLSSARNAGLRHAQGELIGFIDSDDWIEPEMYQVLYDLINDNAADIAQVGYIAEYRGRHSTKHLINKKETIGGNEAMREIGFDRLPNYVWNKLHKKTIISCDFPEGRNFEDIFVYGQWLKNVKTMALDPTPMYHYRMRKGSIIHTDAAKNRYDYFLSCIDRMHMIEYSLNGKKDLNRKNAYINRSAVNAAKLIARLEKDKTRRNEAIRKISDDVRNYPLPSIRHIKLKPWWRAKLLRSHPLFFSWLMRGVHVFDLDSKYRDAHLYE